MSKPRYRWWSYVKAMIRAYPELSAQLRELKASRVTARYEAVPRGGGSGRTVEGLALKSLPVDDQREYDAVRKAIDQTEQLPDGALRLKLIRLVYWTEKPMSLSAASVLCFVSPRTAVRWHGDFIRRVAQAYGYQVGIREPKKGDILVP